MKTFVAEVTQFFLPNGNAKLMRVDLPVDSEPDYIAMTKAGYHFEAEVLRSGAVSLTISNHDTDFDTALVQNGPAVKEVLADMLKRRLWENAKNENTKQT